MKKILFLLFTALGLLSCENTELEKSVFISDIDYPELPKYSEWGYNTFGAYIDREVFVSNNTKIPFKIINTNNITSFIFHGEKEYREMLLIFKLSGYNPQSSGDLIILNDTIINLKSPDIQIEIIEDGKTKECILLNGYFHIKRSQNLIVDGKQTEIILSGIFEFQALLNGIPTTMSDGRFDVGIAKDNFYSY